MVRAHARTAARGMIADSNIVIELLHGEGRRADLIMMAFVAQRARRSLFVNPIIFAESSSGSPSLPDFEDRLGELGLMVVPLGNAEAYRAGVAFRDYRRNGGPRTTILPDFLIGAQAAVRGWPIL